MDASKNFAKSTLGSGIAAGATSLSVTSGGGAKFPAVPFNATIWNSTDYADPSDDPDREIVRVTAIATDTLTIARAQEGTADVAHNTGGKSYKIIAPLTAKFVTEVANAFRIPYGNVKVFMVYLTNLSSGENDMYTCPAGRRAILIGANVRNTTGSSANIIPKLKRSGTYYRGASTTSSTSGVSTNITGLTVPAEAGDAFSINTSVAAVDAWLKVIEFDATSPIVFARLFGTAIANGDTTLYTCPSGKTAMPLASADIPGCASTATGVMRFTNDSGSSRTLKMNLVPSGGSVASTNEIVMSQTATNASLTSPTTNFAMGAGDFVNLNCNGNDAAHFAWMIVQEVPHPA